MPKADFSQLPRTVWWEGPDSKGVASVCLIDQTRLPLQGDVLACHTLEGVELAIKSLALRGAPALGVGAALALALWSVNESKETTTTSFLKGLDKAAEKIAAARPTAVNLGWGAQRVVDAARAAASQVNLAALKNLVIATAQQLAADDERCNRAIGANGAPLLGPDARVLTVCNAGSLATTYFGTALGVVYTAFDQGSIEHVWVTETRPLNQGARLTTWELMVTGVPNSLITDNMAATVMAKGWVDAVLVGADRIAANGDTANKIGTLQLAILARHYGIPFYVCAPTSTIDTAVPDGSQIIIEQRDAREVEGFTASGIILPADDASTRAFDALTASGERELKLKGGHQMLLARKGGGYSFDAWFRTTPPGVHSYNPAFDVTPAGLITTIITDQGLWDPNSTGE